MKLLKKPVAINQTQTLGLKGHSFHVAGPSFMSNVEIGCYYTTENPKDEVWNKLKYGFEVDFRIGKKIERLDFSEENIVLYGVIPIEMSKGVVWDGVVYECKIDYFEVI